MAAEPRVDPQALTREASMLMAAGQLDDAEAIFANLLALHPHHPVALWNLGQLLIERERYDAARTLADSTLAAVPDHPRALLLRGDALHGLGLFQLAASAYEAALAVTGPEADALSKLGLAHAALQDHAAALSALDQAVALRPDDPIHQFRRGVVRLRIRDFEGWQDYEARLRLPRFLAKSGGVISPQLAARIEAAPTADGLAGRRILLLGEQGIGDQVMFASMVEDLAGLAGAVSLVCDGRLARLFSRSFPGVAVSAPAEARISPGEIDRIVGMGSLGGVFRRAEVAFSGAPYLSPSLEARARWRQRLGPRSHALRIGLSWRGGRADTHRGRRSVELDQLRPILELRGCEFVSLQYGDVEAELATAPSPIRAFPSAEMRDFDDLAALTAELDVVVSVQTALVHLCGAIGQTCLTMIPHNPEWRYTASGTTMPWYRSVRTYRQPEPGDWEPVIVQVVDALQTRLAGS